MFDHLEKEAENVRTFYFRPPAPISYTAGQYIELSVPHLHPDKRGQKRWFTLSSSPSHELVSITTKFVLGGGKSSSFKHALLKLQKGDEVAMSEPMGDFVLPKFLQIPLIFVAGGIGITPYHSMLNWLHDSKEERPITMIYGVGSEDEIIFQDTLNRSKHHVIIIVKEPSPTWGGEQGQLNAELIRGLGQPKKDSLIYISGPEPMVEKLNIDLIKQGIKQSQLVTDFFPNYPPDY